MNILPTLRRAFTLKTRPELRLAYRPPLSTAVRCALVRDLPDPVDPKEVVEVDPAARLVGIEAELHGSGVPNLRDGDNPPDGAPTRRRSPPFETHRNRILRKRTVGINVKHPGFFMKRLLELAYIVVVEAVDIGLDEPKNCIVIFCSFGRGLISAENGGRGGA